MKLFKRNTIFLLSRKKEKRYFNSRITLTEQQNNEKERQQKQKNILNKENNILNKEKNILNKEKNILNKEKNILNEEKNILIDNEEKNILIENEKENKVKAIRVMIKDLNTGKVSKGGIFPLGREKELKSNLYVMNRRYNEHYEYKRFISFITYEDTDCDNMDLLQNIKKFY